MEGKDSDKDKEILLEQWRTCVEMANQISTRRDAMNGLFITINLSLIAAISLTWEITSTAISFSGIVMCLIWHHLISYYRNINSAKYDIILAIEERLPSQPFADEWKIFKEKNNRDATSLESFIPMVFAILNALLLILLFLEEYAL